MRYGIKYKTAHTAAIAPITIGKCSGQLKGSQNFIILPFREQLAICIGQ
jgi:hypothetical protein